MVLDLPLAVLLDVVVAVSGLYDIAGGSHGELVDTSVLPSCFVCHS